MQYQISYTGELTSTQIPLLAPRRG
jgi:hypothetical protein